jgi:hypothetical protein
LIADFNELKKIQHEKKKNNIKTTLQQFWVLWERRKKIIKPNSRQCNENPFEHDKSD